MLMQGLMTLASLAMISRGLPAVRSPPDSCWPELEQLLTRLAETLTATEHTLNIQLGPDVKELIESPAARQEVVCKLAGAKTPEDLLFILPVSKGDVKAAFDFPKFVIQHVGGRDGVRKLGQDFNTFLQFWIDVDISTLPVQGFTRDELMQKWEDNSGPFFQTAERVFAASIGMKVWTADQIADSLLESTNLQELSNHLDIDAHVVAKMADREILEAMQDMSQVLFAIIDELLARNWLGLLDTDSCWPELEQLLTPLPRTLTAIEHKLNIQLDPDIKGFIKSPAARQKFACNLAGAKTPEDLLFILPVSKGDVNTAFDFPKFVIQHVGGRDGVRKLGQDFNTSLQFWIDVDISTLPVQGFTRDELMQKWEDNSGPFFQTAERVFAASIGMKVWTADQIADSLSESTNPQELSDHLDIDVLLVAKMADRDILEAMQNMSQVLFAIVDELLARNWLGLLDTGIPEQLPAGETCWPDMTDIISSMVHLSDETPLIELFMSYGMKIEFGIDIINKETRDEQLQNFVCQINAVNSLTDLAELLPHLSSDLLRAYGDYQMLFKDFGGMDGVRSLVSSCDGILQLAIDMDFPHVPIRAVSRQEAERRFSESMVNIKPLLRELHTVRGLDSATTKMFDALYDSADFFELVQTLGQLKDAPLFYQLGSDLPKLQQLLQLGLKMAEELYSHGWMSLCNEG